MGSNKELVVVTGIAGLINLRALDLKGYSVTVIELSNKAVRASI